MTRSLAAMLDSHRVVVSAGSGGVGKTTTAAAIGLYGAQRGRRTVVLTIDPARRLADALGIGELRGGDESEVKGDFPGSLTVMMLDQKSAWDALVEQHAPSAEIRDRVLGNRFYQHLSQTFAGSQEYMAIEQLSQLHASGRFDLIVVDTPPTRHALDFLEAPRKLADFLDKRIVKWFVKPYFAAGWATMQVMNRTANFLLRGLEEATGVSVLVEVSDFFNSMSGLFDGFQERVQRVYQLLRAEETAFVLVASPEEQVLSEAEYFSRKVAELQMPLRAVVFNRVHFEFEARRDSRSAGEAELRTLVGNEEAVRHLLENFDRHETQARGDAVRMESFRSQLPRRVVTAEVPNFDSDLHDLAGLRRMHPYLFGG